MLSIVTAARNDNYGGDFFERFTKSLTENATALTKAGIIFEYIISEWNPELCFYSDHNSYFDDENIIDLVIDRSVVHAEKLKPDIFYEYFAKNAGIRQAKYENILLINADILLGNDLTYHINKLLEQGLDPQKYYRPMYRHNYAASQKQVLATQVLWEPHNPDGHLAAGYSGDFLLVKKDTLMEKGRGYDETDPGHRSNFQTGMDGELLSNMYHEGIRPEMINAGYYHLHHSKNRGYSGSVYRENVKYTNKSNWGFINYNKVKISDQLYIIKK